MKVCVPARGCPASVRNRTFHHRPYLLPLLPKVTSNHCPRWFHRSHRQLRGRHVGPKHERTNRRKKNRTGNERDVFHLGRGEGNFIRERERAQFESSRQTRLLTPFASTSRPGLSLAEFLCRCD